MDLSEIKNLINNEKLQFKKYERTTGNVPKVDIINITDKGINLAKNLSEALNTEHVTLEFNNSYKILKIKPSEKGYKINKSSHINAKAFLNYLEITERGQFEASYDLEDKVIYSVLK